MTVEAQDIMLDDDGDLLIENGDFVIGKSKQQEINSILKLAPGNLKSDPLLGPGIMTMINKVIDVDRIKQRIGLALKRDDKNDVKVSIKNGVINIADEE